MVRCWVFALLAAGVAVPALAAAPKTAEKPAPDRRASITFIGKQSLVCTAAGAEILRVTEMSDMRVDFQDGDLPEVNFVGNGVTYKVLMVSPALVCQLNGTTVSHTLTGGVLTDRVGQRSYDQPQTVTCYQNGARLSQDRGIAMSVRWALGGFTVGYHRAGGEEVSQQFGTATACLIEPQGEELLAVDADLPNLSAAQ